jgi:MFS family permease
MHPRTDARTAPVSSRIRIRNLTWLGHGVNDTHVFILPLVLPLVLRELELPFSTAGLLVSGFLFVMAVSSYVFGRVSDHLPPWGIVGGGFLLAAVCLVGAGLAPTPPLLVASLLVAAVGVGTFHPVAYAQIDRMSLGGAGGTGGAYGLFELWGGVALIGMYVANGSLLASIGWQGVLMVTGIPGFALGLLFLRQARRPANPQPAGHAAQSAERVDAVSGRPAGSLTAFVVVLVAALLRYLSAMAVVTFTPTYLAIGRGLPTNWSVYLAGLTFLGSLVASPLLGRLADRWNPLGVLIATAGLIGPLMILFSLPVPVGLLPPLIVVLGGAIGGCAPAQNLLLTRTGGGLGRGQIFGIMMGILSLMSSVSPAIYGWLSDHFGLGPGLRVLTIPAVSGWVLLVWLGLVLRRRSRATACAAGPSSPG